MVEHLGSSYVATRETKAPPGRTGSGWELMAQRGFDGIGGGGGSAELPRDLDVDSLTFADGTSMATAPDLTPYATKDGEQTLSNKTLASPVVSGDLLPETAGQQALGSAARPWSQLELKARAAGHANAPLRIDGSDFVNTRCIEILNFAGGSSGFYMEPTPTGPNRGSLHIGIPNSSNAGFGSRPFGISVTHRGLYFNANVKAADDNPHAFAFHDQDEERTVVRVQGDEGRPGKLQEWGTYDRPSDTHSTRAWVEPDGTFETVAGVILRSPNGSRYRITVADDGSLETTPA